MAALFVSALLAAGAVQAFLVPVPASPVVEIGSYSGDVTIEAGRDGEVAVWLDRSGAGDGRLTLRVPPDSDVRVQSVRGPVTVAGVRGPLSIDTVDGDVGVSGAGADVDATSAAGQVTVSPASDQEHESGAPGPAIRR